MFFRLFSVILIAFGRGTYMFSLFFYVCGSPRFDSLRGFAVSAVVALLLLPMGPILDIDSTVGQQNAL